MLIEGDDVVILCIKGTLTTLGNGNIHLNNLVYLVGGAGEYI